MKKRWIEGMLALCCAATFAAGDADSPTVPADEPVVLTEESIAEGKRNVENVVGQLETLLLPLNREALRRQGVLPAAPEMTVVEGPEVEAPAERRATLIYQCRYNRAEWMSSALEIILQDGQVEYNDEKNQLIINDIASKMPEFEKVILAMDVPSPQVLIEARVVEFIISDGMQRNLSLTFEQRDSGETGTGEAIDLDSAMGFNNTVLGSSPATQGGALQWYPYISDSGKNDLKLAFQWLLTAQDAKLLSAPNIVISRSEVASITTGQDLPIQSINSNNGNIMTSTTYKRVGVKLEVEPCLINRDGVTLRIYPEVSNVAQYQRVTQGDTTFQVPVITVRSIETQLALEDGQVVVLGGLYDSREALQQERTPFLSDMPYIGELFTSKSKTSELVQLIFFLRVHVLMPEELDRGLAYDPLKVKNEAQAIGDILHDSSIIPKLESTIDQVRDEFIDQPEKLRSWRKEQTEAESILDPAAAGEAPEQ